MKYFLADILKDVAAEQKNGISDLCRMAIIDYVIIHNKSFELILTEDFYRLTPVSKPVNKRLVLGGRQATHGSHLFMSHFFEQNFY